MKCPYCGKVVNGIGRKRKEMPFIKVYEALQGHSSAKPVAEMFNCSVSLIYKLCKENGTTVREILGSRRLKPGKKPLRKRRIK